MLFKMLFVEALTWTGYLSTDASIDPNLNDTWLSELRDYFNVGSGFVMDPENDWLACWIEEGSIENVLLFGTYSTLIVL